jgi:hypothetical protein
MAKLLAKAEGAIYNFHNCMEMIDIDDNIFINE